MTGAAALAALAAFLDPARAFSPAADLAPMRAALKALQGAKPSPLWYVATSGDSCLGGGFVDCLVNVVFFDCPLAYGRACREAEALHKAGGIDSYTMGRAEGPTAERARIAEALAKARGKGLAAPLATGAGQ